METEKSQKQMLETKLAEVFSDLDVAQKQLAQKGWEAAQALAAANDEMLRQRSASEELSRAEKEGIAMLKKKIEELEAQAGHVKFKQQNLRKSLHSI